MVRSSGGMMTHLEEISVHIKEEKRRQKRYCLFIGDKYPKFILDIVTPISIGKHQGLHKKAVWGDRD